MSCKWIDSTLGDFITFKNGKTSPDRNDGDLIPVYGSNGIIGYSTKNNAPENSLIIGRVGSYCGSVYHSPSNCWVTDNAIVGLPKHDSESEFWYFLLLTLKLNSYRSGSGQPLINQTTLKSISIRIPEESSVRSEIGKQLYLFNQKVDLNTQTNQTLEQIAQAIFKSWFVDFEPVKAKMAVLNSLSPRERVGVRAKEQAELAAMSVISGKDETALKQLQAEQPDAYTELAQTAALFPAAMVDSELGEIPEGWEVDTISSKIDVLNGFAFKSKDYVSSGIFVLRTKNFNQGIAEKLPDDVYLPESFLKSHKKYLCEPFDYHMVMVGASVGNRGMFFPELLPALRNQNMWCFRPKDGSEVSRPQVKCMLDHTVSKTSGLASGSAREFFRKGDFKNQKVCYGTSDIRQLFYQKVMPILKAQASLFSEISQLAETRDTLLPKLLSGELTLPNTEEA